MENKNVEGYAIQDGVEMKKRSPEDIVNMWKSVFGEESRILREKLIYIDNEMKEANYATLEGVRMRPVEDSAWLTWKRENGEIKMLVIGDSFRSGIQTNEKGEKSIILTRQGVDQGSGGKKETIRRYSALK